MCGILGHSHPDARTLERFQAALDTMVPRGPDAFGVWHDGEVALGHRRLSILDLSERGAQPMASDDGNVVIVYNGECYNHLELRKLLPDVQWRSGSDTETLLRLYEAEGPDFARRLIGMFAFAIHDSRRRRLMIWRDRFGEKPLYYALEAGRLLFGSTLGAVRALQSAAAEVDPIAFHAYLLNGYVPEPRTILRHVRKLPTGCRLDFDYDSRSLRIHRWWHWHECLGDDSAAISSLDEAASRFDETFAEVVESQALSDVPLGCFLSGGVDSSLVALHLARSSSRQVQTFSVRFEEKTFDESSHARAVAAAVGTEHHEETLRPNDCLALLDALPAVCGEPFADASILPTLLLSQFTRRRVTVALSGDGGDELFLGYDRYRWAEKVARTMRHVPGGLRRLVAGRLAASGNYRTAMRGRGLQYGDAGEVYASVFSGWNRGWVAELCGRQGFDPMMTRARREAELVGFPQSCGVTDLLHYLPGDILFKVDRAAMAHSLETRAPFLDVRVARFAMSLPLAYRMGPAGQKLVLRRALEKHLPASLFDRPKAGFAVPLREWFRGPLLPRLREELSRESLARHGLIDHAAANRLLDRHLSGSWNHERQLFAMLCFQLWHRAFFP